MARNPRNPLTLHQKLLKIKRAGLTHQRPPDTFDPEQQDLPTLQERVDRILELYNQHHKKPAGMIYFIMYDIQNNKVRTHIAKYLKRSGCVRVQKSIFLASTERDKFNEIHRTIKEVQEFYENNDSIFFVPVSVDHLRSMKIVGQSIDYDLVLGNTNTLFF